MEPCNHGKEPRAEVARGIDGVTVHAAEAHADRNYDQPDHRGRKIRTWRHVEFVGDCEDQ